MEIKWLSALNTTILYTDLGCDNIINSVTVLNSLESVCNRFLEQLHNYNYMLVSL